MFHRSRQRCVLCAAAFGPLLGAVVAAAASPQAVVSFDDPAGDADGPGGYTVPLDADFSADVFDLRRLRVLVDGDEALIEVALGAAVAPPGSLQRANSTPAALTSGLFLQNVDIYIDIDPSSGDGSTVAIPGRRVTFADGRTWKRAVVLTPQPPRARAVIAKALGAAASTVFVPDTVQIRGRTLVARVPLAFLGGRPMPSWGWSVQVSGAAWDSSFTVLDRLSGAHEHDAFTMPVETTAGRWNFGGAPLGRWHPQILDVLAPTAALQHSALSSFDAAERRFAAVAFVYGVPPPPPPERPAAPQAQPSVPPAAPPSERLRPAALPSPTREAATPASPAPTQAHQAPAPSATDGGAAPAATSISSAPHTSTR